VLRPVTIDGMTERWLTLLRAPRAGRIAGVLLVLAAFGQALGQAVTLGTARGTGSNPALNAFLYAVALCGLALLSTLPLLLLRPLWAAVSTVAATVLVLAWFPAPTVAGAVAAVCAVWRLGAAGSPGGGRRQGGGSLVGLAVEYLAVGLAVPFLVLALVRRGDVACAALAWAVPAAAAAGITLRAGRAARTYSEAGEALADTLVAHTARGERARIARELHDVVAHHISMIAVLAETGRLATPGLPEAGARRFGEIGDTARAGLTEMRRLLGVLREDATAAEPSAAGDGAAAAARMAGAAAAGAGAGGGAATPAAAGRARASREPQPGLAQLAELVNDAREASTAGTRLIISGPVAQLDPGVELAAYRIVQEALTNARRHAPGAAVDVELRYGAQALRVRVRDNGPGPVTAADSGPRTAGGPPGEAGGGTAAVLAPAGSQPAGSQPVGGHGLLGMRERAFAVGGALYVGAAPGGGFLVEAVLPSEPDPVRASDPIGAKGER